VVRSNAQDTLLEAGDELFNLKNITRRQTEIIRLAAQSADGKIVFPPEIRGVAAKNLGSKLVRLGFAEEVLEPKLGRSKRDRCTSRTLHVSTHGIEHLRTLEEALAESRGSGDRSLHIPALS
jgi:hypothetical protein